MPPDLSKSHFWLDDAGICSAKMMPFSRFLPFQGEPCRTRRFRQVCGVRYTSVSRTGSRPCDISPAHFTRVRTIRIGLPQQAQAARLRLYTRFDFISFMIFHHPNFFAKFSARG